MAITHDLTHFPSPGNTDGDVLGRDATSKIAFYGGAPVAKQQLPATPAVADIAAALVALGLVSQAS